MDRALFYLTLTLSDRGTIHAKSYCVIQEFLDFSVSCIKPQLMNAQILGCKDSDIETYAYEDIVIVRCREGYTLLDRSNTNNEVLTCSSSGRWLSFNDDAIQSEVTCNFAGNSNETNYSCQNNKK